jgi:hypothetical protein
MLVYTLHHLITPVLYTMNRLLFIMCAAVLLAGTALAGGIRDGSLTAYSTGGSIVVSWTSEDESGVVGYVIERRAINSNVWISLVDPYERARGVGWRYRIEDRSAFRTADNVYQYQITQVFGDGHRGDPYKTVVTHNNISGVRRTWGSIKAMFR